jgi:GT2 family glycosyltransferase/glycosyltransferase involved in cell wall biosynthesis
MKRPVAIVVPVHNSKATLKSCLETARELAGDADARWIAVDGGSNDGGLEWLRKQSWIQTIQIEGRGVARALNAAAAAAPGCDLVRLHADVVIETQDWLRTLQKQIGDLPRAAVAGGKLVYADDRIQSLGRRFVSGLGMHPRHVNLHQFEPDSPRFGGAPREVDAVAGAFCYIRREAYDRAGGFDEHYAPLYGDDDDFCTMARFLNYKVYAIPSVKAVHYTFAQSAATRLYIRDAQQNATKLVECKKTILAEHGKYWTRKWGWNPHLPDLQEIRRLYGHTEICWRIGEPMRFKPTSPQPSVDVVLITWNNQSVLQRCLESVAKTTYPRVDVHVVDNASTDGTGEYLEQLKGHYPFPLHVYTMAVNTGVPVGFNWGIVHGMADLVARIDDDVVVPPEWLDVLVADFAKRPFAAVTGPKIINDNDLRNIQCGPYRLFPSLFGHDGEPDGGQADYFARTNHVRGCCNVYRRDVFATAGMFDLRFSPSQVDDPEHHIAIAAAGYEILYNGRVSVIHAQTHGAARSHAAVSNLAANQAKMLGKWGTDVWRILDTALELSREGRILPENGDTSEYQKRLPEASSFPRKSPPVTGADVAESIRVASRLRDLLQKPTGAMKEYFDDVLGYARGLARDGRCSEAADAVQSVLELAPWRTDALPEYATVLLLCGQSKRAETIISRAARFESNRPAVELYHSVARSMANPRNDAQPADRSRDIGEAAAPAATRRAAPKYKVLIVNTFESRVPGGDMLQIKKTKEHLEQLGCAVDLCYSANPDPRGYDIVHVFNLWFPHQTLPQVKAIRTKAPDVPIVMTPIYWDMAEKAWADMAVPELFASATSPAELQEHLRALANGTLRVGGCTRADAPEPNFFGYEEYQRQILRYVDHLFPQSRREMENLQQTLGWTLPSTIVHNAAEPSVFEKADRKWFLENYGLENFVLTVGLVENRKNQLMLLHALKDTRIPVVVIGRNYDRNYLRLCREHGGPRTVFIEHLPHERLASAMKAARVFALPSWMECASLAAVEAALAGCSMVVSDRTYEPEYYKDAAYYCDPASVESIRSAVLAAWNGYDADAGKRLKLKETFTREFTWPAAAKKIMDGYAAAIERRRVPWRLEDTPAEGTVPRPVELANTR